jgi:hypothetical protein
VEREVIHRQINEVTVNVYSSAKKEAERGKVQDPGVHKSRATKFCALARNIFSTIIAVFSPTYKNPH